MHDHAVTRAEPAIGGECGRRRLGIAPVALEERNPRHATDFEAARLAAWIKVIGWETLLNRAGTTFRKLPDRAKLNLDEAKAIRLMLEQPSMIKRPVLESGKTLLVGFSREKYSALK